MVLEILLAGISVAGATLFLGRHHYAVLKAAVSFHSGDVADAEKQLDAVLTWPCLPWERNRWALCANLRIFLARLQDDHHTAETLCEKLLSKKKLATPIQALTYDRLTEAADVGEASVYQEKSAELWESGAHELDGLKMWEMLAYFFWALAEPARAAYCFEHAPKTPLYGQNLYLCYLCYKEQDLPAQKKIKAGLRALKECKTSYTRAGLHSSLADVHYDAGDYQESHISIMASLDIAKGVVRDGALRKKIRILRALEKYEEADLVRNQWLQETDSGRWMRELGLLHDEGEFVTCLESLSAHPQPESLEFQYAWGIVHLELGDPATAAEASEYAVTYQAEPHPLLNLLGAYEELMNRDKIEECLHLLIPRNDKEIRISRARLAFFWDCDPETGKELGVDWMTAFYVGDFPKFSAELVEEAKKRFAHAPIDFKRANSSLLCGVGLRWQGQIEEALEAFTEAQRSFLGSPFQADRARLLAFECRAALGEDVLADLRIFEAQLTERYPSARRFLLEAESVKLHCLAYLGKQLEVIEMSKSYLKKERRKFEKARCLKLKVLALESLGKDGKVEAKAIINLAPDSFLALWAQTRL